MHLFLINGKFGKWGLPLKKTTYEKMGHFHLNVEL